MAFNNEHKLELLLSEPDEQAGATLAKLTSPILILGASGKMGPTLALLAKRSLAMVGESRDIIAVSRFSSANSRAWFEHHQIPTLACDLLDEKQVMLLPESNNIIYLIGKKFGTSESPSHTWAVNTLPPAYVCQQYAHAKIVALSTGSVYPMVSTNSNGSVESDPLTPLGEYANACVARERIFEHFSNLQNTPIAMIRLNYAVEPRYGVLVDIGTKVQREEPVDLTMGYLNCIWGRDANTMILRSFNLTESPARPINLTGSPIYSVKDIAILFGQHLGKKPLFTGIESDRALLNDASTLFKTLGEPEMNIERMIELTAQWIVSGGALFEKPTHYEVQDGNY